MNVILIILFANSFLDNNLFINFLASVIKLLLLLFSANNSLSGILVNSLKIFSINFHLFKVTLKVLCNEIFPGLIKESIISFFIFSFFIRFSFSSVSFIVSFIFLSSSLLVFDTFDKI